MLGLLFMALSAVVLGILAVASVRWGVDSRAWTSDGRPMTIVGSR